MLSTSAADGGRARNAAQDLAHRSLARLERRRGGLERERHPVAHDVPRPLEPPVGEGEREHVEAQRSPHLEVEPTGDPAGSEQRRLTDRDLAQVLDPDPVELEAPGLAPARWTRRRGGARPGRARRTAYSRLYGYRGRLLVLLQTERQSASDDQIAVEVLERKAKQRHFDEDVVEFGAPVELPVGALDRDVVQHHGARKPTPSAAPGDAELFGLAVDDPVGRRARKKPVGGAQVRAVREEDDDAERDQDPPPPTPCWPRFHSLNIRVAHEVGEQFWPRSAIKRCG